MVFVKYNEDEFAIFASLIYLFFCFKASYFPKNSFARSVVGRAKKIFTMKYEKYDSLLISPDGCQFTFVSEGPKGRILKMVQYTETDNPDIYNLAFGELLANGNINDSVKNNNKDRNKILATVAVTVYEFTARQPEKIVFFTGSSSERTRLYRMALTNNISELSLDFEIFGAILEGKSFIIEKFMKGKDYNAFAIKRKIV